jgi:hypothetical protein
MKRITESSIAHATILSLVVFSAACADRMPLDVDAAASSVAGTPADVAATAMHYSLTDQPGAGSLDDVVDRILPALTDEAAARPLVAALAGLRAALEHADQTGVPALIENARSAVNRYGRSGNDEADVDVIRLAIDQIAEDHMAAR